MAIKVDLNLDGLIRLLEKSPKAVYDGAKRGLHDTMNEWLSKSRDIAPLDSGNLRRQLHTEVDDKVLAGEIYGNAVEYSLKYGRFNYGYWLHEIHTGNLSTPGTVHKFIDAPAKKDKEKWLRHIEKEIEAEAKRKGW